VVQVNLKYNSYKRVIEYYIKPNSELINALKDKTVIISIKYDDELDTKHSTLIFTDKYDNTIYEKEFEHLDRELFGYYVPTPVKLEYGRMVIYTCDSKDPNYIAAEQRKQLEETRKKENKIIYNKEEFDKIVNTYSIKFRGCNTTTQRELFISAVNFPHKNDIVNWLSSYCFNYWDVNVYVKSDGFIDVISQDPKKLGSVQVFVNNGGSLPSFIKFNIADCNFRFMETPYEDHLWRCAYYNDYMKRPHCSDLLNLIGSPKYVNGNFEVWKCGLKSLIGSPTVVKGNFSVSKNKLNSFFGMPQIIEGLFDISNNEFTDKSFEDFIKSPESENVEINDIKHKNNLFVKYRKELFIDDYTE
jgi:hypothetical protein